MMHFTGCRTAAAEQLLTALAVMSLSHVTGLAADTLDN